MAEIWVESAQQLVSERCKSACLLNSELTQRVHLRKSKF